MPWEYNVEPIWQFGQFRARQHRGVGGRLGDPVQLRRPASPPARSAWLPISPAATGTRPRKNLQTFNPMFPTGAYLNLANPIGPANFIQVHPFMDEWH